MNKKFRKDNMILLFLILLLILLFVINYTFNLSKITTFSFEPYVNPNDLCVNDPNVNEISDNILVNKCSDLAEIPSNINFRNIYKKSCADIAKDTEKYGESIRKKITTNLYKEGHGHCFDTTPKTTEPKITDPTLTCTNIKDIKYCNNFMNQGPPLISEKLKKCDINGDIPYDVIKTCSKTCLDIVSEYENSTQRNSNFDSLAKKIKIQLKTEHPTCKDKTQPPKKELIECVNKMATCDKDLENLKHTKDGHGTYWDTTMNNCFNSRLYTNNCPKVCEYILNNGPKEKIKTRLQSQKLDTEKYRTTVLQCKSKPKVVETIKVVPKTTNTTTVSCDTVINDIEKAKQKTSEKYKVWLQDYKKNNQGIDYYKQKCSDINIKQDEIDTVIIPQCDKIIEDYDIKNMNNKDNTLDFKGGPNHTVTDCKDGCDNDNKCTSWVWGGDDGINEKGTCWTASNSINLDNLIKKVPKENRRAGYKCSATRQPNGKTTEPPTTEPPTTEPPTTEPPTTEPPLTCTNVKDKEYCSRFYAERDYRTLTEKLMKCKLGVNNTSNDIIKNCSKTCLDTVSEYENSKQRNSYFDSFAKNIKIELNNVHPKCKDNLQEPKTTKSSETYGPTTEPPLTCTNIKDKEYCSRFYADRGSNQQSINAKLIECKLGNSNTLNNIIKNCSKTCLDTVSEYEKSTQKNTRFDSIAKEIKIQLNNYHPNCKDNAIQPPTEQQTTESPETVKTTIKPTKQSVKLVLSKDLQKFFNELLEKQTDSSNNNGEVQSEPSTCNSEYLTNTYLH